RIQIIHVDGILGSIYWTLRLWQNNYPIVDDFQQWQMAYDDPNWRTARIAINLKWLFLRDFFASRGYLLYFVTDKIGSWSGLRALHVPLHAQATPPYAQNCCGDSDEAQFEMP
ncbi:hypothetical protein C0991_006432, partial [Blastosporella zonata]